MTEVLSTDTDSQNVLIVGGSGLIGSALRRAWTKKNTGKNQSIFVLSRRNITLEHATCVQSFADLPDIYFHTIVNLAGASVDKRWSSRYKQTILDSRIQTTQQLVEWLARQRKKPNVLIQASAIGYYGARNDNFQLGENALFVDDFIHQLCDRWEKTALDAKDMVDRICIARIGVVISNRGGLVTKLRLPLSLGIGGRFGHGRQILSWIAIDDLVDAFTYFRDQESLSGVFNCTAPHPVSNAVFIRTFAKILRRPACCHMPFLLVKILFGEMGEQLLLRGQYVIPQRLIDADFTFRYTFLDDALRQYLEVKDT